MIGIIKASTRYGSVDRMNKTIFMQRRKGSQLDKLPKSLSASAVFARVNFGRWIADCPDCGGAELVDPLDPRFYCHSCDNLATGLNYRSVIFPENWRAIENELIKRPAIKSGSLIIPRPGALPREWIPTESVDDLRSQRESNQQKRGKL